MTRATSALLTICCSLLVCIFATGCPEKGTAERAGENVDQAVEKVQDELEDAGDAIEDATDGN